MKAIPTPLIACAVCCAIHIPITEVQALPLYSFQGAPSDGALPSAALINNSGTLYGTTSSGGAHGYFGYGTMFSLNLNNNTETMLYSFCSQLNCTDGSDPEGSVTEVGQKLYGTTYWGGTNSFGTVFSFKLPNGPETVLYSFCGQSNCADGEHPRAGVISFHNMLYGTTQFGGGSADCCGTLFSVNPMTGAETVLHTFQGAPADGAYPWAGVIVGVGAIVSGYHRGADYMLFGTTAGGGAHQNGGTVFSFDLETNAYSTLYSFCGVSNCGDGGSPTGVIIVGSRLYGATSYGGTNNLGTVFSFKLPHGPETVLYSFCSQSNCADGKQPYEYASLIDVNGTLYGTTNYGGASNKGAVYSLNLNGNIETVLHSFGGGMDGANPFSAVLDVGGTLYGTTWQAGTGAAKCIAAGATGCGTVFSWP